MYDHLYITTQSFWCWPGGCPQSSDPGLEDAQEEGEGVFPGDNKVNAGEKNGSMDDEANDHCHHVHAQLPSNDLQVLNGNDLAADQTGNTKWRVPDDIKKHIFNHLALDIVNTEKLCSS